MSKDTDGCPATNQNGDPCGLAAGWGTDNDSGPCKFHGGASPKGPDHPRYKHGAFSDHLRSDLTEAELEAVDEMVDAYDNPEEAREIIAQQAAEAWLKYKRSADTRFLREYRQLADTFNLAPNADKSEVEDVTEGGFGANGGVDEATKEAVRDALADRFNVDR